jgi:hypothetical protein
MQPSLSGREQLVNDSIKAIITDTIASLSTSRPNLVLYLIIECVRRGENRFRVRQGAR